MPGVKTKDKRNPYLILLLKHMLAYETGGLTTVESHNEIAFALATRHVNSSKKIEKHTGTKTQRIIRSFLDTKDFNFSEDVLNRIVAEVTVLGRYDSWKEFEDQFKKDLGFLVSESKFMDQNFSQIGREKTVIHAWASERIIQMHYRLTRDDQNFDYNVIRNEKDFVIRNVTEKELLILLREEPQKKVSKRDFRVQSQIEGNYMRIRNFYRCNRNVVTVFKDNFDIWAYIVLLPITDFCYRELKRGIRDSNYLGNSDIYDLNDKQKVNCIFVFDLQYILETAYLFLKRFFSLIISSIANVDSDKLVICTMSKSNAIENLIEDFSLVKIDGSIDFYEISWQDLEPSLTLTWNLNT